MDFETFNRENRQAILNRVQHALGRTGSTPEPPIRPQRQVVLPKPEAEGDLTARFSKNLQKAGGSIVEIATPEEIPVRIAALLNEKGVPLQVAMGKDEALRGGDWQAVGLSVKNSAAGDLDSASVTRAFCGVAEVGSVVFCSGADNPTPNNFLAKYHFAVLSRKQLVPCLEDVWGLLRDRHRARGLPRAVNFITGPSATADVEATLQVGVHGPHHFEVLLTD
ncbi:L-lactate dehydrogenase complex protein LldG [Desulfocicer vacuolatum DSM 3385]|uniref:L-lactate dehydrogenase complex protein LldG n=1 Tax=Desulfocicer vacuolatum DSM 3385 TaxID=1121400 RepID=A0A1W2EPY2_9BACT|nr:LUD domain-containing protein [Desulfocicer vacuolatum]SMD11735.1 L-lactate dehydrogenase complex protein LldG [Desulfocicer vacuolatum DSM 3385]